MTKVATVSLMLLLLLGCDRGPSSGLSLAQLNAEYAPQFYATDDTIIVVVENVPGLNLVEVRPIVTGDRVILEGQLISSGGGGTRTLCADVSEHGLRSGWSEDVWWANPSAKPVQIAPIITGEEAGRITKFCS